MQHVSHTAQRGGGVIHLGGAGGGGDGVGTATSAHGRLKRA